MTRALRLALVAAVVALAAASAASASRRSLQQFNAANALNQGQNNGNNNKDNKANNGNGNKKAPDGGDLPPAPPGKPSGEPPAIDKGPSGIVKDDGQGSDLLPSDSSAASDTRGAKSVQPTALGIKATGDAQKDESGKGLITGVPIDVENAKSQNGAKQASSASFESTFNDAGNNGLVTPEVRGARAYGGGSGTVNAPVQWLHAGIYTIPRYEAQGFLSAVTGLGATQVVTIVLENWAAKLMNYGPSPIFRAPSVGYSFSWGRYEYLW